MGKGVNDETGYIEDIVALMSVVGEATAVFEVSSSGKCEAAAMLVVPTSVLGEARGMVVDMT